MAKKEISLLPEKNAAQVLLDKLTKWVLSVGRYIVVFTELIVIGAFLSRFWLDRKNTDLSEKIRQQKAILSSTQTFEREFHLFQRRLKTIKDNFDESHDLFGPLSIIGQNLPQDILLKRYIFSRGEETIRVDLQTQVFSEAGLAEFIGSLIEEADVNSVQIGTITKQKGQGGMSIKFVVHFKYPDDQTKKS